jgi:hypothetical protein
MSQKSDKKESKGDRTHWVEVEITFPFIHQNDKLNKKDVPMLLELKSYNGTKSEDAITYDYVRFDFFRIRNSTQPPSILIHVDKHIQGYSAANTVEIQN